MYTTAIIWEIVYYSAVYKMTTENDPLITSTRKSITNYEAVEELNLNDVTRRRSHILQEDRIIYTWSDINVVSTERRSWRSKYLRRPRINDDMAIKKNVLKNVNGVAYPGELLAIMGSSGAGKTSLLNALTFRTPKNIIVTGLRCVNSIPVNSNSLTSRMAYVQQDDLFIGSLTVREHLIFQALVRMDRHIRYGQRMNRVDEVISELSLGKCEHTVIGIPGRTKGISGGEMKRLSFASEVLTNPSLMFCDEPTSGVDSFMALNVVHVLKSMAQTGKTIVCTVHQPSSELYALFDKLLFMAEGRVAFLGTPEEATDFLEKLESPCPNNYNPADYFIQLLAIVPNREESCRQAIYKICDTFQKTPGGVKIAVQAATVVRVEYDSWDRVSNHKRSRNPYKTSWCAQFRAVLWRSWLTIIKEPLLIKVRLIQTVVVALLIGCIYYGQHVDDIGVMNINGALFIFLTNATFQNVFAVIHVFCAELQLFLRENQNGMYRTDVYFLCKTIAEIPIFTGMPFVFVAISYYLVGLNPDPQRFFIAAGVIVLTANTATSLGYFLSCASSSLPVALSLASPIIFPFLLFGGFFLNTASIPIYLDWLSYLSWFRYGNEALMINQWRGVQDIKCTTNNTAICPRNGDIVLKMYNFSEGHFMMDILALVGLTLLLRSAALISLLLKTYRPQ